MEFDIGQRVSAFDARADEWTEAEVVRLVHEGIRGYCGDPSCCSTEPYVFEVRFTDGHLAELADYDIAEI